MSVIELRQKKKPGPKGKTYEEFLVAYKSLIAGGDPAPTIKAIRTQLGGGSEERICQFKQRYLQEDAANKTEKFKLPQELELAVAQAISDLAATETEKLAAELRSHKEDLNSLAERSKWLVKKNGELQNQILEMQLLNAKLEGLLQQQSGENEQLRGALELEQMKVIDLTAERSAEKARGEVHNNLYRLVFKSEHGEAQESEARFEI